MKKCLALCLALLLPALAGAAEFTRLPEPLVFHAKVASPEQCVADLDRFLARSIQGTRAADSLPPGMLGAVCTMMSPLPPSAWKIQEEAHVLAFVTPEGKPEFGFVVNGNGLARVAAALPDAAPLPENADVLVATLNKSRRRACFREIGGGKLLITENAAAGDIFSQVLEHWEPALESDAPIACRVDLAAVQSVFKTHIATGFAAFRDNLDNAARALPELRDSAKDEDEQADAERFEKLANGALATLSLLVDALEKELPSIREADFGLGFADGRLLATSSLGADAESFLGGLVEDIAGKENPDFPFIGAFPDETVFYGYQAAAQGKTADRARDFFREAIDRVFAEAAPETAAELAGLLDSAADAGPGVFGAGAYMTEDGEMLPITYTEWDHPDQVIPLIRRAAALLTRLHGEGAALGDRYLRKAQEKKSETASKDPFDAALENGGFREIAKPVFHSDDGERYGVPYADFSLDFKMDLMFPESMIINVAASIRNIMKQLERLEEQCKFFWAAFDGAVAFSGGALDLDAMEVTVEAMALGLEAEDETALSLAAGEEWLEEAAANRQLGFSLYRPSRFAALILLRAANSFAADNEALFELAWDIVNEVEDDDSFFFSWSGAGDGRLQCGLALPAEGFNEMVRNGFALQNKVLALVSQLGAAMRE